MALFTSLTPFTFTFTFTFTCTSLLLLLSSSYVVVVSASDTESLLKFKASLENKTTLLPSWNASNSIPPCSGDKSNWPRIQCYKGHVWGLRLENMRLKGVIDVQSLQELPYLRTISLMHNDFDTAWPAINKVVGLKTLYLSHNKFSGKIPAQAFQNMKWLKKIYLSNNHFTGPIPSSLASMPRLMELRLEANKFTGPIPNFHHALKSFSVAHNQLEGEIPPTLHTMPRSSFSGNEGLCGAPLSACPSKKKSTVSMVGVVILVIVALIVIGAVILLVLRGRRKEGPAENASMSQKKAEGSREASEEGSRRSRASSHNSRRGDNLIMRLSFVRDDIEQFDLQELLRASAEILGSSCYSSSYKASMLNGPVVVVKRFKQMNNVGREEFQEHMQRIGRLSHPSLLPLVAYYYRNEEKLLVTDFVHNSSSLEVRLHGYQALGQPSLDWGSRLRIVKGVAKGLEYLYQEMPSLIAPHGHLKSSNVLLSENNLEPILTDYGLLPVINHDLAPEIMVSYRSPEYLQHGHITKKTDVWTLGILILEILTGNFPSNFLQDKGSELSLGNWVHSVVPEEWSGEVFDKDMEGTKNSEGEMVKLLKIALSCCQADVDKRWDLKDAVERIQEVNETDNQEDNINSHSSSNATEADINSSKGFPGDLNFSVDV